MNPIIWLYTPLSIGILAVAAIVYLQRTNQAGKYRWTERDNDLTIGCMANVIVATPYLCVHYFAITFTFNNLLPKLPKQVGEYAVIPIYLALALAGSCLLLLLDTALRPWGVWRWLHYWAERRNGKPNPTLHISTLINKAQAFLQRRRRRNE